MTHYKFLADGVVVIHVAYVGFVLFGLLAIVLGAFLRWKWVRNFWFRIIHFLTIAIVVVEALSNIVCPLTTLEKFLLAKSGQPVDTRSFVGRWVNDLLFYEAPPSVFTVCYCIFGALVLATLVLVPPNRPWAKQQKQASPAPADPEGPQR
jgi:hypothetical protein